MIARPFPLDERKLGRLHVAIDRNLEDKQQAERRLALVTADRDRLLAAAEDVLTDRPGAMGQLVMVVSTVQSAMDYRQEGSW